MRNQRRRIAKTLLKGADTQNIRIISSPTANIPLFYASVFGAFFMLICAAVTASSGTSVVHFRDQIESFFKVYDPTIVLVLCSIFASLIPMIIAGGSKMNLSRFFKSLAIIIIFVVVLIGVFTILGSTFFSSSAKEIRGGIDEALHISAIFPSDGPLSITIAIGTFLILYVFTWLNIAERKEVASNKKLINFFAFTVLLLASTILSAKIISGDTSILEASLSLSLTIYIFWFIFFVLTIFFDPEPQLKITNILIATGILIPTFIYFSNPEGGTKEWSYIFMVLIWLIGLTAIATERGKSMQGMDDEV